MTAAEALMWEDSNKAINRLAAAHEHVANALEEAAAAQNQIAVELDGLNRIADKLAELERIGDKLNKIGDHLRC